MILQSRRKASAPRCPSSGPAVDYPGLRPCQRLRLGGKRRDPQTNQGFDANPAFPFQPTLFEPRFRSHFTASTKPSSSSRKV